MEQFFYTYFSERVSCQVYSIFIQDEEQTRAKLATLDQETKNYQNEVPEHRVSAVEGNSRLFDPVQKRKLILFDFRTFAV